jgi:phosphoglycerol transferase
VETAKLSDPNPSWRTEILTYGLTLLLTGVAVFFLLRLGQTDWRIPFSYEHDSFLTLAWTKTLLDNGCWLTNPYLGAPGQLEMYDYPTNCDLHFLALKGLSLFTSDPAVSVNLYFLLSFYLVALTALTALRSMKLARGVAVVSSILYAFLPYHVWRGEPHLFLAAYYMVPLICMVVVCLGSSTSFLLVRNEATGRLQLELRSLRSVGSVLICAAIGWDFPYYPMFAGFFLLVAGLYAWARHAAAGTLGRTMLLVGVTVAGFVGNLSPSLVYWWRNGPNPSPLHMAKRSWTDGEAFGLTVTQLLLPGPGHRLPWFKSLHDKYYAASKLISEGDAMALGTIGSLGFLLLIGCSVYCHRSASERGQRFHLLGVLTVCAVLVCTAGGFGTAFNLLGLGMVRCYNRVSIFIGFLALAAIGSAMDILYRRYAAYRCGRWIGGAGLAALLVLGLADQTSCTYLTPFAAVKEAYQSDADFVARIEASVPKNTMVFQMPYVAFLSYVNAYHRMQPYDHFRGYLHSHKLHWSFGAMHGRSIDDLHAQVASLPVESMLCALASLDFGGIYIDRAGYADNGQELESKLRGLLGTQPLISRNGRLSFFDLAGFKQRLIYSPPWAHWGPGFYVEETAGSYHWRWCGKEGLLYLMNPSDHPRQVRLRFLVRTCRSGAATLRITCPAFSEWLPVDASGSAFTKTLELPPGRFTIRFDCTAAPFVEGGRSMVFGVFNFQLESDS